MKKLMIVLLVFICFNLFSMTSEDRFWLTFYAEEDRDLIYELATGYGIPLEILVRLNYLEADWRQGLVRDEDNGTQSIGMFQLNSGYFEYFEERFYEWESIDGPFDPMNKYHNNQVGCAYLKSLYHQFDGNWAEALAAYNWGPGNVRRGNIPEVTIDYASFILTGRDRYGNYTKRIDEYYNIYLDILTGRLI